MFSFSTCYKHTVVTIMHIAHNPQICFIIVHVFLIFFISNFCVVFWFQMTTPVFVSSRVSGVFFVVLIFFQFLNAYNRSTQKGHVQLHVYVQCENIRIFKYFGKIGFWNLNFLNILFKNYWGILHLPLLAWTFGFFLFTENICLNYSLLLNDLIINRVIRLY